MAEVHHENHGKKKRKWLIIYFFSDDFGLRSPVIQKPFKPKKGIPSIVARASVACPQQAGGRCPRAMRHALLREAALFVPGYDDSPVAPSDVDGLSGGPPAAVPVPRLVCFCFSL